MVSAPHRLHTPPAATRGVLAVVAGRGEGADVYARFGARLSADGYRVGVFAGDDATSTAADAVHWLGESADAPRVLVGSDTGAAAVLAALTREDGADGAIIAGAPVDVERTASDAERTACPVHLGVLAAQPADATAAAVPVSIPAPADLAALAVPVLAFHGGADPVSPFDAATQALAGVPDLEVVETVDGLHDALNDRSHRSVAATIVLWLERLRDGDVRAPIVRTAGGPHPSGAAA